MRLDKFLPNMGVGTRVKVRQLLKKNSAEVNDKVEKSSKSQANLEQDEITTDDKIVEYISHVYIILNKPKEYVSATYDDIDQAAIDLIADYRHPDLFPVGRLDKDTESLLFVTNDRQSNHSLMNPSKHMSKVYRVTSRYPIKNEDIIASKNGIELPDGKAKPTQLKKLDHNVSLVTIYKGKHHRVKRMLHPIDNGVLELKRLKVSDLALDGNLRSGEYRLLTSKGLKLL